MKIFLNKAALAAATLTANQLIETKGYYTAGDGGQARYLIKTAADYGATPDEYGDHTLANGNVAVLQGKITAEKFGADPLGVSDSTGALQAALNKGDLSLDKGTFLFSYLDVPAYSTVSGVGMNTILMCTSTTADALTLQNDVSAPTNYFQRLTDFIIDSSAERQAGATGCGIVADDSDASHVSYKINIERVTVKNQVEDGIKVRAPEQNNFVDVVSKNNGGKGFYFFNDNERGIANTYINIRGMNNGAQAIHTYNLSSATFISPEALVQEGVSAYYDELIYLQAGRKIILINPDVERNSDPIEANLQNTGIKLVGQQHKVLNGLVDNCITGIKYSAAVGCDVEDLMVNITSANVTSDVVGSIAHDLSGTTCIGNTIKTYDNYDSTTINFKRIETKYNDLGSKTSIVENGKYKLGQFSSKVKYTTISSNQANIDLDVASIFQIATMSANLTINNPTGNNIESGDQLQISVTQDGTGGHTVTLGSNFGTTTPTIKTGAGTSTLLVFTYIGGKWRLH